MLKSGTALLILACLARCAVRYELRYGGGGEPFVGVAIATAAPVECPTSFIFPRAVPMGYGQQRYDGFVESLAAFDAAGSPLVVRRGEGPRWTIGSPGKRVTRLHYRVDIQRMEREIFAASDASKLRPDYLGLLGYSIFGYLEGRENESVDLKIEMPTGWPVFTTLAPRAPMPLRRAEAKAADFYTLADSQIAAGPALHVDRIDGAPPLYVSLYSELSTDASVAGRPAREALDAMTAWFGSAPFPHYTVFLELLEPVSPAHGYGFSMEHMDSGTFSLGPDLALNRDAGSIARHRFNFAHHIAHAWLPKRCYTPGYFPFSWEVAPVLDDIWFAEGFGQYAAMAALRDTLPRDAQPAFLNERLERFRSGLREAPAFLKRMPLVELSRIASTRYSEDFRTGRTVFSRGGMMAYEMDEQIRRQTKGTKSLRDALRFLVAWSARERRALPTSELPALFREATGVDTRAILDRWLAPMRE
jgi:predicted metalloprotease with PDZ domain